MIFSKPIRCFKVVSKLCALILLFFTINSCKKKEIDNEIDSVIDYCLCQNEFISIPSIVNSKSQFKDGLKRYGNDFNQVLALTDCSVDSLYGDTSGYYQGSYSNLSNLPVFEFNYQTGCNSSFDNRTRSGKLKATFTKPISQIGCDIKVNPSNYKLKLDNGTDISLNGQLNYSRINNSDWQTKVVNGLVTDANWTTNFSEDISLKYISGINDSLVFNEIYEITGQGEGISRNGKKYSFTVKTPLVKKTNFKWIISGSVELVPEGLEPRIINFGAGELDNLATFEVNGSIFSFNLR